MQTIETERLILRAWRMEDLPDFYAYAKSPNVGVHAGWPAHQSLEESRELLAAFIQADETWAIVPKETGRASGSIGLHADETRKGIECRKMGYVLAEEAWGHGYQTEAAKAVLGFAFNTMGLELVSVHHYPYNTRSRRVIEKCGFTHEGTLRKAVRRYDGEVLDLLCYSMLREEFSQQKA